jgi:hypothetical protein
MASNDEDFTFESAEHELDQDDNAGDELALPQAADAQAEVWHNDVPAIVVREFCSSLLEEYATRL